MIRLTVFRPADAASIPNLAAYLAANQITTIPGLTWTGRVGVRVACIGGVVPIRPGVGEVWVALSPLGRRHPVATTRACMRMLRVLLAREFPTIEAIIDTTSSGRWASLLGMRPVPADPHVPGQRYRITAEG